MGPSILWALNARKSAPIACTSVGVWGTSWAASITVIAPTDFAAATASVSGPIVPRTLDIPENATTLTEESMTSSIRETSTR